MIPETLQLIKDIKKAVKAENYALRSHSLSHMLSEGFSESNIIEAILNAKIIEHYAEEDRCLLYGTFVISHNMNESLHIVIDYWSDTGFIEWLDIVTAYIPRYPFWENATKRGKNI